MIEFSHSTISSTGSRLLIANKSREELDLRPCCSPKRSSDRDGCGDEQGNHAGCHQQKAEDSSQAPRPRAVEIGWFSTAWLPRVHNAVGQLILLVRSFLRVNALMTVDCGDTVGASNAKRTEVGGPRGCCKLLKEWVIPTC